MGFFFGKLSLTFQPQPGLNRNGAKVLEEIRHVHTGVRKLIKIAIVNLSLGLVWFQKFRSRLHIELVTRTKQKGFKSQPLFLNKLKN